MSGCGEHVAADVESVGINSERIVIQEFAGITATNRVLLDKEHCPGRAISDHAIARRIRNGNQHTVRHVANVSGVAARNIDHLQEPPLQYPVVAHLRIAGGIDLVTRNRSHYRREENVRVGVENTIAHTGRLVEGAKAAVNENHELRWTGCAH